MNRQVLLSGLRAELKFLNEGFHQHGEGWLPYAVFEESPLCINPLHTNRRAACQECPLMAFVPEDKKHEPIPCRHIPLNDLGLTPRNLPQWGTRLKMEAALRRWLEKTIHDLEQQSPSPAT